MKILGLGDNVLDVYRNLNISYPGGNAVNVAVDASKLKVDAAYLGNIADDVYGYHIQTVLQHYGVDVSKCHIIQKSTTKRCIEDVVDGEREFIGVDLGENWAGVIELGDNDLEYMKSFDAILTSCNAKIEKQMIKLKGMNGIVSYDFGEKEKYRTKEYFDKVFPYIDLAQFSMNHASVNDIKSLIQQNRFTIPFLITRGGNTPLFYNGHQLIEGVQNYVKPIDTMGAGDSYVTALICSLLKQGWKKGLEIKEEWINRAMKEAADFAASICLIHGGIGCPYRQKKVEAVIFDMDGVIVDSEAYWLSVFEGLIRPYKKTLSQEDIFKLYGCSIEMENEILSKYIDGDVRKMRLAYIHDHPIKYRECLISGVIEFIHYLHSMGIKLVIASSSYLSDIKRMMNECELNDMFDFVVSGEMFEESKPHPEIYNHTVELLGVPKNNIIVIEDSEYGVESAFLAGLDVFALKNNSYIFDLSKAQLVFNSHNDIMQYFRYIVKEREK